MLALSASHWLNDRNQLSGLVYYRKIDTNTLNGDANDEFEESANDGETGANGGLGFDADTAVNNRTTTDQSAYGLGLQWTNVLPRNRLMLGASYDAGRADFTQSSGLGVFNANRSVLQTSPDVLENSLFGTTNTWSVFATDTFKITPKLFLTLSARYNSTHGPDRRPLEPQPTEPRRGLHLQQAQPGHRPQLQREPGARDLARMEPGQSRTLANRTRLRRSQQPLHAAQRAGLRPVPGAGGLANLRARRARAAAERADVERGGIPQQQHGRHPVRQHQRHRHQRRLLHQLRQDPPSGRRAGAGRPVALAVVERQLRFHRCDLPGQRVPAVPEQQHGRDQLRLRLPTTSWSPPATTFPAFRRISST